MSLQDDLKNKRIELGMTMAELAKKVGVSEATISRWESGDIANMKRDKIVLLARALNVSPGFIMGCEDENNTELDEYLEELRTRPELKMLFSITKNATKEDVEKAVRIIEALIDR